MTKFVVYVRADLKKHTKTINLRTILTVAPSLTSLNVSAINSVPLVGNIVVDAINMAVNNRNIILNIPTRFTDGLAPALHPFLPTTLNANNTIDHTIKKLKQKNAMKRTPRM